MDRRVISPTEPPRALRLTVDTGALAANWRAMDRLSGTAKAGAAIKADCYGLGTDICLPVLRDSGAAAFFVAHWSEVPAALAHVPASSIAVLHGANTRAEADYAIATGVVPVVNSIHQARVWREAGGGACHVMVDTGINRLGLGMGDLADEALAALNVDTLMSHLSSADEDSAANARQCVLFRDAAAAVPHRILSLANSAGVALGPDYAFDLTRPGLALYGGVPVAALADHLAQVAHVEAAIIQTRTIGAGDAVGYNGRFIADRTMQTAIVSLGYADGFLRARGKGGALQWQGVDCPVLGTVSMDMIVVDVTDAPPCRDGDWLSVPFDLPQEATRTGLSQYELLTTLGQRYARHAR